MLLKMYTVEYSALTNFGNTLPGAVAAAKSSAVSLRFATESDLVHVVAVTVACGVDLMPTMTSFEVQEFETMKHICKK